MENLKGKVSVRFDLMMVLTGVIMFLVMMIALYQKKYLLDHLPSLVHLVYFECVAQYGSRAVGLGGGG